MTPKARSSPRSRGWRDISPERLESVLKGISGEILQRPPRYSAKKVRGTASHRRARRGEAVELDPVPVQVHELTVVGWDPPLVNFAIRCSSGTYVRAVARDLGRALGVGAHLTELRRVRVGELDVADALSPSDLAHEVAVNRARIEPLEALSHLPLVGHRRGRCRGAPLRTSGSDGVGHRYSRGAGTHISGRKAGRDRRGSRTDLAARVARSTRGS